MLSADIFGKSTRAGTHPGERFLSKRGRRRHFFQRPRVSLLTASETLARVAIVCRRQHGSETYHDYRCAEPERSDKLSLKAHYQRTNEHRPPCYTGPMKALVITRLGGPEVLEVQQVPDPQPGPDQTLMHVEAVGLNFADLMTAQLGYAGTPKPPLVSCRQFNAF